MANDDLTKVNQNVEDYKEGVKKQAEELVAYRLPEKILELNELLKTKHFSYSSLGSVKCDLKIPVPDPADYEEEFNAEQPKKKRKVDNNGGADEISGSKVYLLPSGTVPCNAYIVEIIEIVKPHIRQLIDDANMLRVWISLLIPKIEDGNNFGVSIQEDSLNEVRNVESEAGAYYDQITRYFLTRGKLITKVAKFPQIQDYRRTVEEIDEKQFLHLKLFLNEIRNHYATLHDLITKNFEKIRRPKPDNSGSTLMC